ncbi:diguanylate cyclase [Bremerella sp. JC770]|uniref:GGDEF domain-containing response regulator n=1 Tax=Bremerella sp. JC770 TaxID=3232137 RepID=UPI003457DC8C
MNDPLRILIVEDDNASARLLELFLREGRKTNDQLFRACSLQEAIRISLDVNIDVILLDLGLPDSEGLGAVHKIRVATPRTAIVVLTGHDDDEDACKAIQYGAQAYVAKQERVGPRIAKVVRHSFIRQQRQLEAEAQAHTDPLTGIANRRAFDAELERRLASFVRHDVPFSLAIFDIDWFKKINDQWGHMAGDEALVAVATILQQQTRTTDLVARLGGEEFAFIAPMTEVGDLFSLSSRIRRTIELAFQATSRVRPRLTVSGGVSGFRPADNLETLIHRTDEALYQAKERGRNQCVAHFDKWTLSDQEEVPDELLSTLRT